MFFYNIHTIHKFHGKNLLFSERSVETVLFDRLVQAWLIFAYVSSSARPSSQVVLDNLGLSGQHKTKEAFFRPFGTTGDACPYWDMVLYLSHQAVNLVMLCSIHCLENPKSPSGGRVLDILGIDRTSIIRSCILLRFLFVLKVFLL